MKIRLKPVNKRKIPNPKNGFFLKEEGELVELDKFWRRRLMLNEVVEVVEVKQQKKTTKKKQPKKEIEKKGDE